MEMQQLDFLDEQAQNMFTFLSSMTEGLSTASTTVNSISDGFTALSGSLDSVLALLAAEDITNATIAIQAIKQAVVDSKTTADTVKVALPLLETAVSDASTLIDSLIPMITAAKVLIIGDGNTFHNYLCSMCSIQCTKPRRFRLSDFMKKVCELDGSNVANFVEISTGTYQG